MELGNLDDIIVAIVTGDEFLRKLGNNLDAGSFHYIRDAIRQSYGEKLESLTALPAVEAALAVLKPEEVEYANRLTESYIASFSADSQFEISTTSRYGVSDGVHHAAVFVTKYIPKNVIIRPLCPVPVPITEAEEKKLMRDGQDFSIMKSCFFKLQLSVLLGPGRFANHSCNPNAEWALLGKSLGFKTCRAIRRGEEITISYRRDPCWPCTCEECERKVGTEVATDGGWQLRSKARQTGDPDTLFRRTRKAKEAGLDKRRGGSIPEKKGNGAGVILV